MMFTPSQLCMDSMQTKWDSLASKIVDQAWLESSHKHRLRTVLSTVNKGDSKIVIFDL